MADPDDPVAGALRVAGQLTTPGNGNLDYIRPIDPMRRRLTPLGLYSHAADVVSRLPQAKGSPEQFKATLLKQGVKPDEMRWSGYDRKFAGKKVVTKEELKRHFENNLPDVQEMLHTPGEGHD